MEEQEYAQEIHGYSLEELVDVRDHIDREEYPMRHRIVLERIAELEGRPLDPSPSAAVVVKPAKSREGVGDEEKKSFMGDGGGVFLRDSVEEGARLLSPRAYNALLGLVLVYGLVVNYLMVVFIPTGFLNGIGTLTFLVLYFGSCFLGIRLFTKSDSPWVSFLGYNLVVVPFGMVVNIVLALYDLGDIQNALAVTGMVTAGMLVAGTLFPVFFLKIEKALFTALLIFVLVEIVQWFFGIRTTRFQDAAVALIFCGYIAVDWGRANRIPRTADNAVDSAAALYMDIINLFLRILRLMGKRRN